MTKRQADLMEERGIIPMLVVEMELDTVEVLKRVLRNKMKPARSDHVPPQPLEYLGLHMSLYFKGMVCDSGKRLLIFELKSQSYYTPPSHAVMCVAQSELLSVFPVYRANTNTECTHRMDS